METEEIYELLAEVVREVLREEAGGGRIRLAKRMVEGKVTFEDGEGRPFKEVPVDVVFRKVTSVREQLRVLEQKINNHAALSPADRAEFQSHLTRCYGSLTTFNFLFREESDHF